MEGYHEWKILWDQILRAGFIMIAITLAYAHAQRITVENDPPHLVSIDASTILGKMPYIFRCGVFIMRSLWDEYQEVSSQRL